MKCGRFVLFSKLQDLVPQEEIDLLESQESWKPFRELEHSSQDGSSVGEVDSIGRCRGYSSGCQSWRLH